MKEETNARIESEFDVKAYIQNLRYALEHGVKVKFQIERFVDNNRDAHFTNKYTIAELFPNENPEKILRRELKTLTVENYMRTLKDIRFPNRNEMREFGKVYDGKGDVYIKIRVELLSDIGDHTAFVMSFHFAERAFKKEMFPYRKEQEA